MLIHLIGVVLLSMQQSPKTKGWLSCCKINLIRCLRQKRIFCLKRRTQSPAYTVRSVVEQMKGFDGRLTVQTMFLRGECDGQKTDNTTEEEVSAWLRLIEEIRPRQVMVYSLDRDTPCRTLEKVPREELQAIAARVEALGIPCSVA